MKSLNKVIAMIFFCLQLVAVVAFAASSPEASEPDEKMISESFLKTIQDELKSLNEWGQSEKTDPTKSIQYVESEKAWLAFYEEYYPDFEYDIKKTNSIVTPYIGVVTFAGRVYVKRGITEAECLNAEWQKLQVAGRDISNRKPTLKYAYQSGKWILKEKPGAYRKH